MSYTLKQTPQVFATMDQLSARTLKMMDRAMNNLSKGKASVPLDLKDLEELANGLPD